MSDFPASLAIGFHFFFPIATIWLKRWRDVYDAVWYVGLEVVGKGESGGTRRGENILILSDLKNEIKFGFDVSRRIGSRVSTNRFRYYFCPKFMCFIRMYPLLCIAIYRVSCHHTSGRAGVMTAPLKTPDLPWHYHNSSFIYSRYLTSTRTITARMRLWEFWSNLKKKRDKKETVRKKTVLR